MNRELIAVIDEIGRQKGIDKSRVIGAIESALQTAAKKRFGQAENIQVEIDSKTGEIDQLDGPYLLVLLMLSAPADLRVPLPGRGAFDLVTFMPGVTTADGSSRGAMVNGLPTSTVNITRCCASRRRRARAA